MSQELQNIIKINKPNLSMSSLKIYMSGIRNVAQKIFQPLEKPEDFVIHKEKIIKYIKEMDGKQNGKTKLAGIIATLKPYKSEEIEKLDKETKEALDDYMNLMRELQVKYEEEAVKQQMNPTQKANYLPWDEVKEIYEKLKRVATPLFKMKPDDVSNDVYDILKHFVVLSLYVLIPPRRSLDFSVMKVKNYDSSDNSKDNYILSIKGRWYFIFNNYKNASRLGKQSIEVPPPLKKIIKDWLRFNNSDFLIPNKLGRQIQHNKINSMLNEIFKRNIGVSLLRHSYITSKYGDVDLQDMMDDANKLGQGNINTLLKYVDKEKAKQEDKEE